MKILFLMMGGVGSRLGAGIPKQFISINGVPIFIKILELYNKSKLIDHAVIVCNKDWLNYLSGKLQSINFNFSISITSGGQTRAESVKNALKHSYEILQKKQIESGLISILIHDTTHPYLDVAATTQLCKILETQNAATVVSHVWDTVYLSSDDGRYIRSTLPRANIAVGASPEGFNLQFLQEIYDDPEISNYTSVADFLLSKKIDVNLVWTNKINLKITYQDDLKLYKAGNSYFEGETK